jgi:hypothetical protein
MVATLTLRAFTGTGAATMSAEQAAIELVADDDLTGGSIDPGSYSYERWLALRVDSAPTNGVTNFWFQNTGDLPTGVTIRFGISDTPRTPIATVSDIATMELVAGRHYIFDTNTYDTAGDLTRYLVLQEQALITAPSGAIGQQTPTIGWSEN